MDPYAAYCHWNNGIREEKKKKRNQKVYQIGDDYSMNLCPVSFNT